MTTRTATSVDIALAKDRLRGTGAWNGQGLLVHLALTSRHDAERTWMEPLKVLCEQIVNDEEDGLTTDLTAEQADTFDAMAAYADEFFAAIRANDPNAPALSGIVRTVSVTPNSA
jgi:hypothetical protein